jgi:prolyl oligopeptidase family protein
MRSSSPSCPLPLLLALVVAPMVAACNLGRPPTATAPPNRLAGVDTIEATLDGGWITVRIDLPRQPDGPKPVVITPVLDKRAILERGIGVVEYRTHWELLAGLGAKATPTSDVAATPTPFASPTPAPTTIGGWLLAAPRPGIVGQYYFNLITSNAQNIPKLVDYLRSVPQIDPSRIAIAGSSTSGFLALEAMIAEPRLAAAVVLSACGDYFAFLRSSSLGFADNPEWVGSGELPLDPDYAAYLRSIEPIASVDRFPPRPLLYLVGAKDRAIPVACSERTARDLQRAYARAGAADRFTYSLFEEGTHALVPGYQRTVIDWLEENLAQKRPH